MASPPGGAPHIPAVQQPDRQSESWAAEMSSALHRAPDRADGNGETLGCLRFGTLGVRISDLVATYPRWSDVLSPAQVAAALRARAELRATHVNIGDDCELDTWARVGQIALSPIPGWYIWRLTADTPPPRIHPFGAAQQPGPAPAQRPAPSAAQPPAAAAVLAP
eukprot:4332459-Alexandrium_andersonii.AAC.1